ncbi:MAG: DUF1015 family protein [Candidatus Pelagibacterales bacterium]|jgi:uncharacterized protein (DUF1015 family)|tara:strand:+ start:16445 stop:17659 length:1215 start_codon:yes stop_codon:yes gene_type:complete
MPLKINSFIGLRPIKKLLSTIVSSSFDNLSDKEIKRASRNTNWNFLNILSPKILFPNYSEKQLTKYVRDYLKSMIDNKVLFRDEVPNYYIYKLSKNSKTQYGIIASIEITKQSQKLILPHEETFIAKEKAILRNLELTKTQVGPVYLSYENKNDLILLYKRYAKIKPEYFFISEGGTKHSLWATKNDKDRKDIHKALAKIKKLYIADGHHRFAAVTKLLNRVKNKNIKSIPLLAALFDHSSVNILSYNRLVKLKDNNPEEILHLIKKSFPNLKYSKFKKPNTKGEVMIFICRKWFTFNLLKTTSSTDNSKSTDIDLINKLIINKICRIKKNEYKNHISFLPGKLNYKDLEKKVKNNKTSIGFFVCPMTMHEIMSISNKNAIVPQKSTYFDPKLIDGLVNLEMKL